MVPENAGFLHENHPDHSLARLRHKDSCRVSWLRDELEGRRTGIATETSRLPDHVGIKSHQRREYFRASGDGNAVLYRRIYRHALTCAGGGASGGCPVWA
jgi:hypothetical protein